MTCLALRRHVWYFSVLQSQSAATCSTAYWPIDVRIDPREWYLTLIILNLLFALFEINSIPGRNFEQNQARMGDPMLMAGWLKTEEEKGDGQTGQ